jgi:branched-chain amino acid transport system ATP-binding protein
LLIAAASRERQLWTMGDLNTLPERAEMMQLLDLVGADDVADQKTIVLPEGKRKLVDIAMALALKPKLVLMDEPTSGVASAEKFEIMDVLIAALGAQGVTSVFVEHDMEVVERYSDRVAVWSAGKIQISGKPAEVLKNPDVVSQVIGI